MGQKQTLFFLLYFFCTHLYPTSECFTHTLQPGSNWLYKMVEIDYCINKKKVGFIAYDKVAVIPFYVLHSFYVYPQHRSKGHGRRLLNYTCDYLKAHKAKTIYLQPGPFELDEAGCVENNIPQRKLKLQRLVRYYKKNQFVATSKVLSFCAALLYKCMRIDEDADYLMVKKVCT